VVVKIKHNACAPLRGGVMVATLVVPEMNVINVVGPIVAAAAIVGGNGFLLPH
jgi:hypothetical protein